MLKLVAALLAATYLGWTGWRIGRRAQTPAVLRRLRAEGWTLTRAAPITTALFCGVLAPAVICHHRSMRRCLWSPLTQVPGHYGLLTRSSQ